MQGKGVMCQKFIIGVNRSVLNRIINNIRLDLFKWKAYSCFICLSLVNILIIGYSYSIQACELRYTEVGEIYVKGESLSQS